MLGTIWDLLPKKTIGAIAGVVMSIAGYQFAVDSQDHITQQEALQLKANGVELLIQGITYWSPCSQPAKVNGLSNDSLKNAQAVGLRTAAYVLVDPHSSGAEAVDRAMRSVDPEVWDKLEFVAIDFEVPGECYPAFRIPVETIYAATDRARELGKCVDWPDGDCKAVLYTSCGEWTSRLFPANPLKPSHTVLWNASWDGNPDVDYERCQFGSFFPHEVYIEQYSGGTTVGGVSVDPNTVIVYEGMQPKPEPTPTPTPVITPPGCGYTREEMLWALTAAGFIEGMAVYGGTEHELHPYDKGILDCISR